MKGHAASQSVHRVVIVGAGFGGLNAAEKLAGEAGNDVEQAALRGRGFFGRWR